MLLMILLWIANAFCIVYGLTDGDPNNDGWLWLNGAGVGILTGAIIFSEEW